MNLQNFEYKKLRRVFIRLRQVLSFEITFAVLTLIICGICNAVRKPQTCEIKIDKGEVLQLNIDSKRDYTAEISDTKVAQLVAKSQEDEEDNNRDILVANDVGACKLMLIDKKGRLMKTCDITVSQPDDSKPEAPVPTETAASAPTVSSVITNQSAQAGVSENSVQTSGENQPVFSGGVYYFDGIPIINKSYPATEEYTPGESEEARQAFNDMKAFARDNNGISLNIVSGYRTYSYQKKIYEKYSARDTMSEADTYSARPGHSEHQTGLAFDVNMASDEFDGTPEAIWLAQHCHEYGFVIRFPKDKEDITGYQYEPWHIRYVGVELATYLYNNNLCLEEYFHIDSQYANTYEQEQSGNVIMPDAESAAAEESSQTDNSVPKPAASVSKSNIPFD